MAAPFGRPQERIGDFHVSPRGWNGAAIKVAWSVKRGCSSLLVVELLYEKDGVYCGGCCNRWNTRAGYKEVRFPDYEPFVPFPSELL